MNIKAAILVVLSCVLVSTKANTGMERYIYFTCYVFITFVCMHADSLPENFDRSCEEQKERFDYIQCTEDGNFSPVQCLNNYCFCVNIENGIRLNDKEFKEGVLTEKKCLKGIYKIIYIYVYIYIYIYNYIFIYLYLYLYKPTIMPSFNVVSRATFDGCKTEIGL